MSALSYEAVYFLDIVAIALLCHSITKLLS